MNDYWDYLEHGLKGKERKGHKYYARVPVGTNKLGFTQYRYFYDPREYGAYMSRKNQDKTARIESPYKKKDTKTTYYVTGTGNTMTDQKKVQGDIDKARGRGVETLRTPSDKYGGITGISADSISVTAHTKTKHDYKTLRKVKSTMRGAVNKKAAEVQSAVKNGKKKINDLILKAKTEHNRNQWHKTYMAIGDTLTVTSKNQKTGEVREKTYNHTKAATNFESTMKQVDNKNKYKYEPIYQANKAYESASRILSNGRKRVQSLFKRN